MQNLTPEGLRLVTEIAARNEVSLDAALALLAALARGDGRQAQFHHPDLGGMGQWSQGGMIMIGDMFNQGLKYRVDRLCNELAALLQNQPSNVFQAQSQSQSHGEKVSLFVAGSRGTDSWWPADLGVPASVGAQNDMRYAYFPDSHRLLIKRAGRLSVYDAGDHRISGFSQQQSGDSSLTFTSQLGLVRIDDLRLVSPPHDQAPLATSPTRTASEPPSKAPASSAPLAKAAEERTYGGQPAGDSILAVIERLADLRQKNILTEEEFVVKKRELLSRL